MRVCLRACEREYCPDIKLNVLGSFLVILDHRVSILQIKFVYRIGSPLKLAKLANKTVAMSLMKLAYFLSK